MASRYVLRWPDGDDAGEFERLDGPVQVGDVIPIDGDQRVRVLGVISIERMSEFVDGAAYGVLEVEPVE